MHTVTTCKDSNRQNLDGAKMSHSGEWEDKKALRRQAPPHTFSRQCAAGLQNFQRTTPTSAERARVAVIAIDALLFANRLKIQCSGI